jgi:hypothetical protein
MTINKIINKLKSYDFHDMPVSSLNIIANKSVISLRLLQYDEFSKDYRNLDLEFMNVTDLNIQDSMLTKLDEMELYGFDYSFNYKFNCHLTFLLGSGRPSFEIKFNCELISIKD